MDKINFCEFSDDKLNALIEFLGMQELVERSKMRKVSINGKIIEKSWNFYDVLIIQPSEIFFIADPLPKRRIFDAETYLKIVKLINTN